MRVETILGRGAVTPFRRQGRDFAHAEGSELVRSRVRQILLTRKGDLRWRPDFGLALIQHSHRAITEILLAEVQAEVTNALLSFEPQIEVLQVDVQKGDVDSTKLTVRVAWRAVTRSSQRNTVLTDAQVTEVRI